MPVLENIGYLATCRDKGDQSDIHPIREAAVAWEDGKIAWVGKEKDLPIEYAGEIKFDADNKMVIPGLVDCHTHLAFGGWRQAEFARRVKGEEYLDIAKSGGGILSTVEATRDASEDELYEKAESMLHEMSRLGVTTIECKSGYGLSIEDELKLLRVYKRLNENNSQRIISTFLGAHTIPPDYKSDRRAYMDLLIKEMIPAVKKEGLASFCDVFVEDTAFSIDEAREILVAGKASGLSPKLHADQMTSFGGAELAAEVEATSADHLEKISPEGIEAMAEAGVVAVTLPLASLYTQEEPLDCRPLLDEGVQVAVATDFNPGSAPSYDLPLAMMLACNQGRLSPSEALKGATINAAKAIKCDSVTGSIEEGKSADFAIIDSPDPDFWMYHFRPNRCVKTIINGKEFPVDSEA